MEEEIDKDSGRDMTPRLIGDLGMRYATENSKHKIRYGLYECPYCGREWEALTNHINSKSTKSCGCYRRGVHNLTRNRFYPIWYGIIRRCTNQSSKDYMDYGGRGITVCEEWLDVTNFIAWCELTYPNIDNYSIDRIDNNVGYSQENCRWVDKTTQVINRRMNNNNTSGFVGVRLRIKENKWISVIKVGGKGRWIGSFPTIEEAVQARDNYIIENNLPHKLSTDYNRN